MALCKSILYLVFSCVSVWPSLGQLVTKFLSAIIRHIQVADDNDRTCIYTYLAWYSACTELVPFVVSVY